MLIENLIHNLSRSIIACFPSKFNEGGKILHIYDFSSIKSLEVYVKPEDMAAYYVINGKENGKIEL